MKKPRLQILFALIASILVFVQPVVAAEETSQPRYEMLIERDIDVPVRDGIAQNIHT